MLKEWKKLRNKVKHWMLYWVIKEKEKKSKKHKEKFP